jgi:hypothetical protein
MFMYVHTLNWIKYLTFYSDTSVWKTLAVIFFLYAILIRSRSLKSAWGFIVQYVPPYLYECIGTLRTRLSTTCPYLYSNVSNRTDNKKDPILFTSYNSSVQRFTVICVWTYGRLRQAPSPLHTVHANEDDTKNDFSIMRA